MLEELARKDGNKNKTAMQQNIMAVCANSDITGIMGKSPSRECHFNPFTS